MEVEPKSSRYALILIKCLNINIKVDGESEKGSTDVKRLTPLGLLTVQ